MLNRKYKLFLLCLQGHFLTPFYCSFTLSSTVPTDLDAMVDPLPVDRVSSMYTEIYQNDWATANNALQKDKLNLEQAAQKLLTVLIVSL